MLPAHSVPRLQGMELGECGDWGWSRGSRRFFLFFHPPSFFRSGICLSSLPRVTEHLLPPPSSFSSVSPFSKVGSSHFEPLNFKGYLTCRTSNLDFPLFGLLILLLILLLLPACPSSLVTPRYLLLIFSPIFFFLFPKTGYSFQGSNSLLF